MMHRLRRVNAGRMTRVKLSSFHFTVAPQAVIIPRFVARRRFILIQLRNQIIPLRVQLTQKFRERRGGEGIRDRVGAVDVTLSNR